MLKVIKFSSVAVVAICALVLTQCAPYEEEGISLPGAPVTSIDWSFIDAVDSTGAVIGIDSNRIAVSADAVEGAFLHLWDFGNGMTSDQPMDTAYYPVEGEYEVSYSVHTNGGTSICNGVNCPNVGTSLRGNTRIADGM